MPRRPNREATIEAESAEKIFVLVFAFSLPRAEQQVRQQATGGAINDD
jgi:hypothetical protein